MTLDIGNDLRGTIAANVAKMDTSLPPRSQNQDASPGLSLTVCSEPDEGGRWKDQRDKKQLQTIRFVIDEIEIGGGAWCTRRRKGGVLLRFSRIKIRLSWHQQEFTRNLFRLLVYCGFLFSFDLQVGFIIRPVDRNDSAIGQGPGTVVGLESPFLEYSFIWYSLSLLP